VNREIALSAVGAVVAGAAIQQTPWPLAAAAASAALSSGGMTQSSHLFALALGGGLATAVMSGWKLATRTFEPLELAGWAGSAALPTASLLYHGYHTSFAKRLRKRSDGGSVALLLVGAMVPVAFDHWLSPSTTLTTTLTVGAQIAFSLSIRLGKWPNQSRLEDWKETGVIPLCMGALTAAAGYDLYLLGKWFTQRAPTFGVAQLLQSATLLFSTIAVVDGARKQ
jgi:hypothetical protein